jgi:hypothetical protein
MPSAALIELAQVREHPVHGCIKMRCLLCDPLTQLFELTVHVDCISSTSDISFDDHGWSSDSPGIGEYRQPARGWLLGMCAPSTVLALAAGHASGGEMCRRSG